jgi:hypothetical protein
MASFVTTINSNQYVGDSLSTINNNYANINTQVNNVLTNTSSVSGNVIRKGTTISKTSNFVYGTTLYKETGNGDEYPRNTSILDKWVDVYTNPSKDPLRLPSFTNDNYTRNAYLQGKIYTRNIRMASTSFYRLARFSDNTTSTPLEVVDIAACEGNINYSHSYNTIFKSVYTLLPNTSYIFGLQHWWPSTGAQDEGGVQINGWQTPASDSWGKNTGTTYKYIYADDATIGYPNTGIEIKSYLKLTII